MFIEYLHRAGHYSTETFIMCTLHFVESADLKIIEQVFSVFRKNGF